MTRFSIRGIFSRKLRTALTAIAIVLGVAMVSGTYVLTDSIYAGVRLDLRVDVREHRRRGHGQARLHAAARTATP